MGLTFQNINTIEITDISFIGSLEFIDFSHIYIDNVNHEGLLDTSMTYSKDSFVTIKNYNFISDTQNIRANSLIFNINGHTFIENAYFTASFGCTESH